MSTHGWCGRCHCHGGLMEWPQGHFSFNSDVVCRTSSHIWGRWYLPIFLFRDGSLTLMNKASFIFLRPGRSHVWNWRKLVSQQNLSSVFEKITQPTKLFIFCSCLVILHKNHFNCPCSIKMNNEYYILQEICNSDVLYWHNIVEYHYPTIILNSSYFFHPLPFLTKKTFILIHVISK